MTALASQLRKLHDYATTHKVFDLDLLLQAANEIDRLEDANEALREEIATIEELERREATRLSDREDGHAVALGRYSRTLDEISELRVPDAKRCELLEAAEGQYRAELAKLYR